MQLGRHLAYVALAATEPSQLDQVFGGVLGLPRLTADGGVAVYGVGHSALAVFPLGHPGVDGSERAGVHHIALGVADIEAAKAAAAAAGVEAVGQAAWALDGCRAATLASPKLAHVETRLVEMPARSESRSAHIERIDHIGIASADNAVAREAWVRRLGCPLESEQTDVETMIAVESFTSDKYGVVYHSRSPVVVGGLRVGFITVGDTELEFLANMNPAQSGQVERNTAGNTRQDQGAIAKYVATRGPGLHHVALKTADIDGVLGRLGDAGVPLIDRKGRPGSRRARIGFLDRRGTGGVLLHLVERP